ncbi:hypothetical protein QT970_28375 [Microcoleus sp. herbarium8]
MSEFLILSKSKDDYEVPSANCQLSTVNGQLPTINGQLPTAR